MANYTWSTGNDGTWSDPSNWSPNGVPAGSDDAFITLGGSYQIDLDVGVVGSITLDALGASIVPSIAFTLNGLLDVQAGTFVINNTISGGTIAPDGGTISFQGGTLDGVTYQGPLDLTASEAAVTIENGITFSGAGAEQILIEGASASLSYADTETLDNVVISIGNASSASSLIGDAGLTLGANSTVITTGVATLYASLQTPTSDSFANIDNKGVIIDAIGSLSSSSITNEGTLDISDGQRNSFFNLVNSGDVTVSSAGTSVFISGGSQFGDEVVLTNSGTLDVSGVGTSVTVADGNIDNTGTIALSGGATLEVEAGSQPSGAIGPITFLDDAGTLKLDQNRPQDGFTGTLTDFSRGDVLDLSGMMYTGITHVGDTLTVSQAAHGQGSLITDSFNLSGQNYTDATFTLVDEGSYAEITTDAPCYCAGTRILTDRGERPVEVLEVGDLVVTRQHGVDTLMPVRWVGQRCLVVARHPEPEQVAPICISRNAIGPGQPCRDLYLSPDHAIQFDGMLIQARQLVNGMTIRHALAQAMVTYHHVELDQHMILVANGLPCESYLDTGNRKQFDNGRIVALHGGAELAADRDVASCLPLATDAVLVRPVWDRLAERAIACGQARLDPAVTYPDIRLEATDGTSLERLDAEDGRIRFRLPPNCLHVRVCSGSDYPATLSPWCDDRRRLGIAVSAITLCKGAWRQDLALDHLQTEAGWWPVESTRTLSWRWSNGDALIELPEPGDWLDIVLHAVMPVVTREVVSVCARAG